MNELEEYKIGQAIGMCLAASVSMTLLGILAVMLILNQSNKLDRIEAALSQIATAEKGAAK